jgi:hypothetical protein
MMKPYYTNNKRRIFDVQGQSKRDKGKVPLCSFFIPSLTKATENNLRRKERVCWAEGLPR